MTSRWSWLSQKNFVERRQWIKISSLEKFGRCKLDISSLHSTERFEGSTWRNTVYSFRKIKKKTYFLLLPIDKLKTHSRFFNPPNVLQKYIDIIWVFCDKVDSSLESSKWCLYELELQHITVIRLHLHQNLSYFHSRQIWSFQRWALWKRLKSGPDNKFLSQLTRWSIESKTSLYARGCKQTSFSFSLLGSVLERKLQSMFSLYFLHFIFPLPVCCLIQVA